MTVETVIKERIARGDSIAVIAQSLGLSIDEVRRLAGKRASRGSGYLRSKMRVRSHE